MKRLYFESTKQHFIHVLLVSSSVQAQVPVSVHRLTYATPCLSTYLQGTKAYFVWVVFRALFETDSSPPDIMQAFVVWCDGVDPWVDVSEIPCRLTEASVAKLGVCVALGWSLYEI